MPLKEQNALFDFYTQVFKWVIVTAKSQGKMDTGITIVSGESVSFSSGGVARECCTSPTHAQPHLILLPLHGLPCPIYLLHSSLQGLNILPFASSHLPARVWPPSSPLPSAPLRCAPSPPRLTSPRSLLPIPPRPSPTLSSPTVPLSRSPSSEPEVIFKDPISKALTVHYSLEVDSGLSFSSALAVRDETLQLRSIKSNLQAPLRAQLLRLISHPHTWSLFILAADTFNTP